MITPSTEPPPYADDLTGSVGAVVALKPFARAKSRLRGLPEALRERIAWCLAADTLAALAAVADRVVVVSDQPDLAHRLRPLGSVIMIVDEGGPRGINAALECGEERLRAHGVELVLGCVGDLPCLRSRSVRRIAAAARRGSRFFVADERGVGTTMLLARGVALRPRFQGRSAAAHAASGAVALGEEQVGAVPDARHDVDTQDDLVAAWKLGVGPATAALFGADGRLGRYRPATVAGSQTAGSWLVITEDGLHRQARIDAASPPHPGARVHLMTSGNRVLSAWI